LLFIQSDPLNGYFYSKRLFGGCNQSAIPGLVVFLRKRNWITNQFDHFLGKGWEHAGLFRKHGYSTDTL